MMKYGCPLALISCTINIANYYQERSQSKPQMLVVPFIISWLLMWYVLRFTKLRHYNSAIVIVIYYIFMVSYLNLALRDMLPMISVDKENMEFFVTSLTM